MNLDAHSKFGLAMMAFTLLLSFCNNTKKSGPVIVITSSTPDWSGFYTELNDARHCSDSMYQALNEQLEKQKKRNTTLVQEHADGIIPLIDY